MKRPREVGSSSDHYSHHGPLKSPIPFPYTLTCPSPVCTPSAHPFMCLVPEYLHAPPQHPSSSSSSSSSSSDPGSTDSTPVHASGPYGSSVPLSPSCAIASLPWPSQRQHHALSYLPAGPPFDIPCPDIDPLASLTTKGKAKELPPTLPPLSLSPSGLCCSIDDWSPLPGPSSYRSSLSTTSSHSPSSSIESPVVVQPGEPLTLTKVPSRTKSLSNLSVHSTASSMSRIRIKLATSPKAPVNLARKLLSRNKTESATGPVNAHVDPLGDGPTPDAAANCVLLWQTKDMTRASSPRGGAELSTAPVTVPDMAAIWRLDDPCSEGFAAPRGKSRSYSSPFPQSALDMVPHVESEENIIVVPLPAYVRDLFDEMLPRELQLRVLSALILLHEADHEQVKNGSKWSVLTACSSKNRWVGRNRAMRELVKLSRVSRLWRTLVFDGQLWQNVNLQAFPFTSSTFLTSLVERSGPFIKNLDLSGHSYLLPSALIDMAGNLCVCPAPVVNCTYTQLTTVTLQGCTSLTTQSLHSLLVRSPFLRSLNVKGLKAVANTTFDVLALCPHLTSLDMSRCPNIDGDGVCAFAGAAMARGARLALKELRLCGLAMINDDTLATLGKAAPHLEVLDLSYCCSLHNSALEVFVSCTGDGKDVGKTILLTSREAGRDPRDSRRYRRRVTALRHISLSGCIMLTDTACSNLAYSVPRLEFLELAGVGQTLKDDGLLHLLHTTPFIRKLDLEDASDITDAVLQMLTPVAVPGSASSKLTARPQPGHALEHLTVSGAANLTNDAFKALVRGCPRLRVLEADNTAMSGAVLKDFVRQVRERGINDAKLVVVDCRSVGERAIKDVTGNTRPRKGWRSWEARKLGYLDGRDGEDIKVGQDECDEKRVVIKSFYSWQTVDAVRHARERRKKANKKARSASEQASEFEDGGRLFGRTKWWALSRTPSGNNTPGEDADRDGCVVM